MVVDATLGPDEERCPACEVVVSTGAYRCPECGKDLVGATGGEGDTRGGTL